jgi:YD repeat-containing protein
MAEGFEVATADEAVSFVVDGAAVYLLRGDERTLVLEPAGFERGSHAHNLGAGRMRERSGRIELARGDSVQEWYRPRALDLEQGWTLASRLGDGDEPLRVVLRIGPDVQVARPSPTRTQRQARAAIDDPAEREPSLVLMVGDTPITYSGLAVHDAAGSTLPSRLRLIDDAVVLEIDDSHARYPVTVDPLIALGATAVPNGGASLDWASASTVDGNQLFIGQRDGVDSGYIQGRVHQYSWSGTAWSFVRTIRIAGTGSTAAFGTALAVHGDWLVVGAPQQGTKGTVHAIRLSGGFNGSGVPNVSRAIVPTETVTTFGTTVSISGSRLAVGTGASGRAYVYNRSGDDWTTSTANKLTGTGRFGTSVALDRQNANLLVISAPTHSTDGIVHIYQWSGSSWGTSTQIVPQYEDQNAYGASVAVDGGRVAIACLAGFGNPRAELVRALNSGSGWTRSSMFFSTGYISTSQTFAYNDPNRSPSVAIARDPFAGANDIMILGLPNGVQASNGSGAVEGTVDVSPSSIAAASRTTFGGFLARGRAVSTDGRRVILGYQGYIVSPFSLRGFAHSHDLRRQNGDVCTATDQCGSGYCVDGVCCNSACGGGSGSDCLACNAAQTGLANGTCGNRLAGTVCRSTTGVCDVAETCTGTSGACPANAVRPSSYQCRAPAAACDAPENCDGASVACPSDVLRPQGHVCRANAGACDVMETCDGVGQVCPADEYLPPDTACRAASPGTPCDVMEACSGTSAACPADRVGTGCETSPIGNGYGGSVLTPTALAPNGEFADGLAFLYEGSAPYQRLPAGGPLAPGTIKAERAAAIFGYVYDEAGGPIAGAAVRILHHAELGLVPTRDNGRYDIVVNGGGALTVQIDYPGHVPVQRTVGTEWNDSYHVDDVVLTPFDNCGAAHGFDGCTPISQGSGILQVVQGTNEEDDDGSRQATLMIPAGTTAHVEDPALGSVALPSQITIRATELTVGPRGPNAMPGDLPLATAYNYAVELSVDEANGARVVFEDASNQPQPITLYVENFLDIPVGADVPLGYYDRDTAAWVGAEGGRVIELLSVAGGVATVDLDGDGLAETGAELDAIGLNAAERQELGSRYPSGTTLWRLRIDHFTPWDCNWPYGPPDDANVPSIAADGSTAGGDCEYNGSIIRCENQTLGEEIPIAGTDLALRYASNTVPGRLDAYRIRTRVSVLPQGPSYTHTSISVCVAGRNETIAYDPAPTEFQWEWDGLDGYGRRVPGRVTALVTVCNHYRPERNAASNFGRFSPTAIAGNTRTGSSIQLCDWQRVPLGVPNHGEDAFFGWQLDALARRHFEGRLRTGFGLVTWGDGSEVNIPMGGGIVDTLVDERGTVLRDSPGARIIPIGYLTDSPSPFWAPTALAHADDGSLLVGYRPTTEGQPYCNAFNRIVRISASGVEVIAGAPCPDQCLTTCNTGTLAEMNTEEGALATSVTLGLVQGLEVAPDGSILVLEHGGYVRRILTDGTIRRVAGIEPNSSVSSGTNGPALAARISQPRHISVAPDGTIYILETDTVRQIGSDGVISTVFARGEGVSPSCSGAECHVCHQDTWPAGERMDNVAISAIGVSPTGQLYMAMSKGGTNVGGCLLEMLPDRSFRRITGFASGDPSTSGDGEPAIEFHPTTIGAIEVGRDAIYLRTRLYGYPYRYAVHSVQNGTVELLAIDGGSTATTVVQHMEDAIVRSGLDHNGALASFSGTFALSPRGELAIATLRSYYTGIQRIYPGRMSEVRSGELVLDFDGPRHLATRHHTTGTLLRTFERANQRITAIVDADGNRVLVERGTGYVRFVPPFGPATRIEDTDGDEWADRIQYEDSAARAYVLDTDAGGLLHSIEAPDGRAHQFFYDDLGRLVRDEQPGGRIATLVRDPSVVDVRARRATHSVSYRSPTGRATRHVSSFSTSLFPSATGEMTRILTLPDGTTSSVTVLSRRATVPSDNLPGFFVRQTEETAPDGTETQIFETIGEESGFGDPLPARTTTTTADGRVLHAEQTLARTRDPVTGAISSETRTSTLRGSASSRAASTHYDAATRTLTSTSGTSLETETVHDASNRPVAVHAPGLAPVEMAYDSRGRLTLVRQVSALG